MVNYKHRYPASPQILVSEDQHELIRKQITPHKMPLKKLSLLNQMQ